MIDLIQGISIIILAVASLYNSRAGQLLAQAITALAEDMRAPATKAPRPTDDDFWSAP